MAAVRGRDPRRLLWRMLYSGVAAHLPSGLRSAKRFRAWTANGFCESVHPTANINRRAVLSWQTVIGAHGGVGERCVLTGPVTIGDHVTMGPDCSFITGDHPVPPDFGSFRDMTSVLKPILVEDDCFIGARVTVLPGVRVGRGSLLGAASVVVRDVPDGSVVVGNPAREVGRRRVR